jgi:hypothetical protein
MRTREEKTADLSTTLRSSRDDKFVAKQSAWSKRGAANCLTNLSSRPERTRISYFATLTTTTYAALRKQRRRNFINATELDRKYGGA